MTYVSMTEPQITNAINRIEKRLDWIEEQLARVVGSQYVAMGRGQTRPDAAGVPADVLELVRAGNRSQALKRYRELTGANFAQAREAIDKL